MKWKRSLKSLKGSSDAKKRYYYHANAQSLSLKYSSLEPKAENCLRELNVYNAAIFKGKARTSFRISAFELKDALSDQEWATVHFLVEVKKDQRDPHYSKLCVLSEKLLAVKMALEKEI